MKYVMIAILMNSLIASLHDSKEACEGRAAMVREKVGNAKCVEAPGVSGFASSYPGSLLCFDSTGHVSECK